MRKIILFIVLLISQNAFGISSEIIWKTYNEDYCHCSYDSPYPLKKDESQPYQGGSRYIASSNDNRFKAYFYVGLEFQNEGLLDTFNRLEKDFPALKTNNKSVSTLNITEGLIEGAFISSEGIKKKLKTLTVKSGKYWVSIMVDYDLGNDDFEQMGNRIISSLNIQDESKWRIFGWKEFKGFFSDVKTLFGASLFFGRVKFKGVN